MVQNLFYSILNLQLTACYVILFVLLLRFFLRKQPKVYSYTLWSVVLFRLLCPFSLESVWSLIPKRTNASQTLIMQTAFTTAQTTTAIPTETSIDLPTVPMTQVHTVDQGGFDWQSLLPYLWLLGIAVLLTYSVFGLIKLKRNLNKAVLISDNIYCAAGLETAFVMGIVHPKIYLPDGLSDEEREYILLHEQTHLHRGDHIIKILAFAALCIHWFNPLVWLSFLLSTQDMEMSCDEAVIAKLGSGVKKAYSSSLLSLAAGKRLLKATPLAFGEGDTKLRIKNVLNYKKPVFRVSILLAVAVILVSIGLVCDPISRNAADTTEDISEEEAGELMQLFFPEPYKLEADGSKNVVGNDAEDWIYNLYLDVNKTTSKTGSEMVTELVGRIAVDGSNKDLWKLKDDTWTLDWDYLEIDYETLWENRTEYIGDNSKVSAIAGNLPYPDYVKYEGISIQSSKEPYRLTLHLSVENDEDVDRIKFRVENDWELILRSLIGNLGEVVFEVRAPIRETTSTRGYEDNSEQFAASETLEGFTHLLTEQESRRRKGDADSNSYMINCIEGMKRAAMYDMTWPEGYSCEKLSWGLVEYDYLVTFTLRGQGAIDEGSEAEQLLRSNTAAIMDGFIASKVEYHFEGSDQVLIYSSYNDRDGIFISEEDRDAVKDEAEYLQNIVESVWTMEPSSITFPAYDQSNGYNDDIMSIEPFEVSLTLPERWSIKSGQMLDGRYCSIDLWTPLEIYDTKGKKVGSIAYNTYQKYEGAEDLPQAIYSGIAVPNHYQYNCQEPTYQVWKEHSYGTTAITEVYLSAIMSEQLGFGGDEVINKGILCYNRDLDVYVAMELDGSIDDSVVQSIAESLGITGSYENGVPID